MDKTLIRLNDIDFYGHEDNLIFSIKEPISFNKGDVIYLEADNASGKTTLLKFLSATLEDENRVKRRSSSAYASFTNQSKDDAFTINLLDLNAKKQSILIQNYISFFLDKEGNAPKSFTLEKALKFPIEDRTEKNKKIKVNEKQLIDESNCFTSRFKEWFIKDKNTDVNKRIWINMSAGQQQALFIMQTLLKASILKTPITILDEPLNFFSYRNRENMSSLILDYINGSNYQEGVIFLVSHQQEFEDLYLNGINKKVSKKEILQSLDDVLNTYSKDKLNKLTSDIRLLSVKSGNKNSLRKVRIFSIENKFLREKFIK
jgi:ABC-type molybdenum transport system ATPase subunit/photorepair protein PhrA